jgi:hypothetical protein
MKRHRERLDEDTKKKRGGGTKGEWKTEKNRGVENQRRLEDT